MRPRSLLPSLALLAALGAAPLIAEEGPSLRTELDLSFLYRYRSSDELVEPYAYKSGIDLALNYFDLPPFLRASFDAGGAEGLAIGFEAAFGSPYSWRTVERPMLDKAA